MHKNTSSFYLGLLKSDNLIYNLTNNNIIGRNPEVNIVLNHPSISKEQAQIIFDEHNTAYISDLNSSNGTWLNNNKLISNVSTRINSNDRLRFGKDLIEYSVEPFDSTIVKKTIRIPSLINDDKVSLVNIDTYQGATKNHFVTSNNKIKNNFNTNTISFRDSTNNIQPVMSIESPKFNSNRNELRDSEGIDQYNNNNNEDNTLRMSSTLKESQDKIKSSLYQNIFKSKTDLEKQLKEKSNEINNISAIYDQLNDNYNKLKAKHNALLVYSSKLQKQNDSLSLLLKEKTETMNILNQSDLGKIILEKSILVKSLSTENSLLKKDIDKLTTKAPSSNKTNDNNKEKQLLTEYITENNKLKQILKQCQSNSNECSRKWNELLQTNQSLNDKVLQLQREKKEVEDDYRKKIEGYDKRIDSILIQIPKAYDQFNLRKEEAAQFLVNQVKICFEEKDQLIIEKCKLNDKLSKFVVENEQLKHERSQYEKVQLNMDVKQNMEKIKELEDFIYEIKMRSNEEDKLNYEELIKRQANEISIKDKLIEELKENFDLINNDK